MRFRFYSHRRAVAAVLGVCLTAATAGAARAQESDPAEIIKVRLAVAGAQLDRLYADADAAILAYEEQRILLLEATEAYEKAKGEAEHAADRHKQVRTDSVRYAVSVYQGADLSPIYAWTDDGDPYEAMRRDDYLKLLDDRGLKRVSRANAADVVGEALRRHAKTAQEARGEAAVAAAEAKDAALSAVDAQASELESILARQTELEAALSGQSDTAELEAERERALQRAKDAVAYEGPDQPSEAAPAADRGSHPQDLAPAEGSTPRSPFESTVCVGGLSDLHPNGQIPVSALCPLPQPGGLLRADAAAAFIELDGAYRDRFGRPMCVTDSYRPFTEQVRLFREKPPGMAARPGGSTHGLGIAVDLCGGVHEHDSQEHSWMLRNAPSYGWVNPDWALDGFEPWHWEYQPR